MAIIGRAFADDSRQVFRSRPKYFVLFLDQKLIPCNKQLVVSNLTTPAEQGTLQYYLHLHTILIHAKNKKFHKVRELKPKLMELASICMEYVEKNSRTSVGSQIMTGEGAYLAVSNSLKEDYNMVSEWCDL